MGRISWKPMASLKKSLHFFFLISIGLFCLMDSCFSKSTTIEKMLMVVKGFCICHKDGYLSLYTCQNSRLPTKNAAYCLHRIGVMVASQCKPTRWTTALMAGWWWNWGVLCMNGNWGKGMSLYFPLYFTENRNLLLKKNHMYWGLCQWLSS